MVHFSSTDTLALLPGNSQLSDGAGTFDVSLNTPGKQTITVTDTSAPECTMTSHPISTTFVAATRFQISAPTSATSGVPLSFTVTALDPQGNTAAGYAGTVHFSSPDPFALLPANSTFANGVGAFNATLDSVGSQTVTATDLSSPAITGTSGPIVVTPIAASDFLVAAPNMATTGARFDFNVTALDPQGHIAKGYAGTVHFSSTDPLALLPADATAKFADGVGGFSVVMNTSGNQTITLTDTTSSKIVGTSDLIVVSPAATHFHIVAPMKAEANMPFTLSIRALDASGNTAFSYSGTVDLTSTDTGAILPPTATLNDGVGTFSVTLTTAGKQTITATDSAHSSISGTTSSISVHG